MVRTRLLLPAALVVLSAFLVAACGGGGNDVAPPKTTTGAPATIGPAKTSLGSVLVDSQARTVYLFKGDVGARSACSGACAQAWPPVLAHGRPSIGSGAKPSLIGTTRRGDGALQLTYHGHPLYRFAQDHKPGDVTGQGVTAFGAQWFTLSAAGNQVSGPAPSSGGSSPGGSNGY
jgi:predicted lipoprotein with Yx(FWY)xxD motif